MSLALMPLPAVKQAVLGTFVGSCPMWYTVVNLPLIGAAICPCISALAHGNIVYKLSLLNKFNSVFCLHSFIKDFASTLCFITPY